MKIKGFTLIEMLGVIVIITLLTLLVLPNITNLIKGKENVVNETTKTLIYGATDLLITDNDINYPKINGNTFCIGLNELVNKDLLKGPITNFNKEDITNSYSVKMEYNNGFTYNLITNEECSQINAVNAAKKCANDGNCKTCVTYNTLFNKNYLKVPVIIDGQNKKDFAVNLESNKYEFISEEECNNNIIIDAAKKYTKENIDKVLNSDVCIYLTLCDLKKNGYLDLNLIEPITNQNFENNKIVKINKNNSNIENLNITYEVNPENYSQCSYIKPSPKSFANDSWETIIESVKEGNLSAYNIGDQKELTLTGFGTFTVRIANMSTPNECNTTGFSQTACGFVIEFVDVITTHIMNEDKTVTKYQYGKNEGGWKDTPLRAYLNSTIYNALPQKLKENILDTTVVSSHGSTSGETNLTTSDKLYLLSTKEIYAEAAKYDTCEETRQLDYYYYELLKSGVAETSVAHKYYNGNTIDYYWLRSAVKDNYTQFYSIKINVGPVMSNGGYGYGVAPAFRLEYGTSTEDNNQTCP